jgi:hypothetical protein
LLEIQEREAALSSHPAIQEVAEELTRLATTLDAVVWSVGPAAERVAGAAIALSGGALQIANWNTRLDGQRVLVFAVCGVSPLSLLAASSQVKSMGAKEIHACGVDIAGADANLADGVPFTSFSKADAVVAIAS